MLLIGHPPLPLRFKDNAGECRSSKTPAHETPTFLFGPHAVLSRNLTLQQIPVQCQSRQYAGIDVLPISSDLARLAAKSG
jgi:hypothetical protein